MLPILIYPRMRELFVVYVSSAAWKHGVFEGGAPDFYNPELKLKKE